MLVLMQVLKMATFFFILLHTCNIYTTPEFSNVQMYVIHKKVDKTVAIFKRQANLCKTIGK